VAFKSINLLNSKSLESQTPPSHKNLLNHSTSKWNK